MSQNIRQLPADWVKLNLGCNRNSLNGWVNIDIQPLDGVDVVADLEKSWGWEDNSVHYIRAFDIVEHLREPIHTMNEAWRVLGHGGLFEVWVPSTDGRGAFQDPTHVSFWNRNSFSYYSKNGYADIYPDLIKCDFQCQLYEIKDDNAGIIWTWALCRAIKSANMQPVIPDAWYAALTHNDPNQRCIAGFKGDSIGTMPLETP